MWRGVAVALAVPSHAVSWDHAYYQANAKLAELTTSEKYLLMQGRGWYVNQGSDDQTGLLHGMAAGVYVGYTHGIESKDIPSQNMGDAANGFRTQEPDQFGTSTSWPGLLAVGASWDPDMVYEFAQAMSEEFVKKGSNMLLGPSINIHRSAKGGRNFEYMSGEDPYLGAQLTKPFVEGVSSKNVMTSMKHYIFNNQETNRMSVNAIVDDHTAWNLYYPPFQAAVDAGVTTAMCAYNKIDGEYACSNPKQLQILKQKMGFRGFVHSDWAACHDTTVIEGLDQEMPGRLDLIGVVVNGTDLTGQGVGAFNDWRLDGIPTPNIDNSVRRILASMYKVDVHSQPRCNLDVTGDGHACDESLARNASSVDHNLMARDIAKESIVLLKNEHSALPLTQKQTIAIVGFAADAPKNGFGDYFSAGGSGHVEGPYAISALNGIRERALALDYTVITSATDNVAEALDAASRADVTIVVGGTTSGEGADRTTLELDGNVGAVMTAVGAQNSAHGKRTIAVTITPGAIVMPWRDNVDAILTMFLSGQETGHALAAVIFGDHAPSGRLTISMPATEKDIIEVSTEFDAHHTEGMRTGYRNTDFKFAYPFGHGLTYAKFQFSALQIQDVGCNAALCLTTRVTQSGERCARAVPQLYLEFPSTAQFPTPVLKGFKKTGLLCAGHPYLLAQEEVVFQLTHEDLSYWLQGQWMRGYDFTAYLGESSRSIVSTMSINLTPDLQVVV